MSRLRNLLGLSFVPRWTTHPLVRPQSVAEHSHRVAIIALTIYESLPSSSKGYIRVGEVLRWAMVHDGPECLFGDIPAPVKKEIDAPANLMRQYCPWYAEEQKHVTELEMQLVHIADLVESLSWIASFGHRIVRDHFSNEPIEHQLRRRVHDEAREVKLGGFYETVTFILGEVAP